MGVSVPCRPLAFLIAMIGLWAVVPTAAPAVFDFSSPVTTVSASQGGSAVTLDAFDPNAGGLVSTSVPSGSSSDLLVNGGVAAWSSGSRVYYYIYDSFRRTWVGANLNAGSGTTFDLRNTNGVVAWTVGATVRYAAYDWTRSEWKTDSAALGTTATSLSVVDGLAAGTTSAGVFYAAYDPRAGVWKKESAAVAVGQFVNLMNAGGVIVWTAGATYQGRAYDPISGSWKSTTVSLAANASDLKADGGVAAWIYTPIGGSLVVGYSIFDGPRSVWVNGNVSSGYTTDLTISNSTVVWSTSSGTIRRGYNAASGAWTANPTTPRAAFLPSTNSVNAPFTVAFIDLSIGGNAWSWSFGEGLGSSTRRSPIFRYTTFGQFFVTETVSGPGGVSVTNVIIRTDTVSPTGTLTINNGDATTTNLNVTLQLSASDNSGVVANMRFSNDAMTWSDWESFAAAKPWVLITNSGTKTVYGQYRDPAGNVSTNVFDSIAYDSTPPPVLSIISTNAPEGGTVVVLAVLDHAINRPVSARYATSNGTATDGEDYTATSGVVSFAPNTTTAQISIPILTDTSVELNETFFINLSNPTDAILDSPSTVTIIDDDVAAVSLAASSINVGEEVGSATIAVRLNAASGQTVSVRVVARPGTAADGSDFISTNTLLVFQPGQTNRTFNLAILEDTIDELTETISISLTNLTNAVLGVPAQSIVSILDNDQPILSFSADQYSGFEDEFSITVNVQLSKPYSQQVSATYTIFGGTATPGADYTILGNVFLPPSVTNASLTIFPINDNQREPDETIRLRLTDIFGASAGRTETTVTIRDEDGAPRFTSTSSDGALWRATVRGKANQLFGLWSTTNFIDWTLVSNYTNTPTGTMEITAPRSGPRRYFRTSVSP